MTHFEFSCAFAENQLSTDWVYSDAELDAVNDAVFAQVKHLPYGGLVSCPKSVRDTIAIAFDREFDRLIGATCASENV